MGIVKDLYSFPEEQKIGSGALDFDGFFFQLLLFAVYTRLSRFISHSLFLFTTLEFGRREVDFDFLLTHMDAEHNTVRENSSTHIRVLCLYDVTKKKYTHTHTLARIRRRTIYFPIYLFNGSNATKILCWCVCAVAAPNETESKQCRCRPFAGRNT